MKKWLKNNQPIFVLAIVGIACFFVYSFLAFSAPKEIFNSPDETANYVFSCNYSNGSMGIAEPDNLKVNGVIIPRSATSNANGDIVPGYFLGMPIILGVIADLFGCYIIPFIIPIVSAITPIFLYLGLRKIFEKEVAMLSALLLFFHPIFIYYSAKSLMPNVLFVDLLIISLALLLNIKYKKGIKNYFKPNILKTYALAGLLLGLALTIRPSEIYWVAMIYLALLLFQIKKANWLGIGIGIIFVVVAFLPTLFLNKELYGGYFQLGYNTRLLGIDLNEQVASGNIFTILQSFFSVSAIFPFGIKMVQSITIFINYFWRFLAWFNIFLIPGIAAFFIYFYKDKKNYSKKFVYLLITLAVSAYLIIYYGAYIFYDHFDASRLTIGTSYLRYWLPIFVLLLPFMSYSLFAVWKVFEKIRINIKVSSTILFILVLSLFTFNLVFVKTDESLFAVKRNLEKYNQTRNIILEKTEDNAIIITDRSDKIFFPKRKVIVFLENYTIFPFVSSLLDSRPIYYYSMLAPKDMEFINRTKINQNLKFELNTQTENFYLYKIFQD